MEKIEIEKKVYEDEYKADFCKLAIQHEMVILPSFHRCGNTLTRELLEGITNILTGSDDYHIFPNLNLNGNGAGEKQYSDRNKILGKNSELKTELEIGKENNRSNEALLKFKGQWITDQSVWIYKTHYPARKGKGKFDFDKILLVVRNPFDALESMFNLYLTNSHSKNIHKEEYCRLFQDWEGLVKEESQIWNKFYEFWYDYFTFNSVPIYIVKYENLIIDTKTEIMNILSFLLNYQDLTDSFIEVSVDNYLRNRRVIYKPRKGTNFHSIENFTKDQINFILENSIKMFYLFGYDITFSELIKDYELIEKYDIFILENKHLKRSTEINKNSIQSCLNEKYPFEYINIPKRVKNPFIIDSDRNLLKFCNSHRSGPRMARLSFEMSKLVKLEVDQDEQK